MNRMTERKWRAMSDREQVEYLASHEIRVESKLFMDGGKPVGDVTAITEMYRAWIGDVLVTGWSEDAPATRIKAAEARNTIINRARV